jgi:hypothetical protein
MFTAIRRASSRMSKLDAGFAKGQSEFLATALVCLAKLIARARYYG